MAISGASVVADALGRQRAVPVSEIRADGTIGSTAINGQQDVRLVAAAPAPAPAVQPAAQPESNQLVNQPESRDQLRDEILTAQRAVLQTQTQAIANPTANANSPAVNIRELLGRLDTLGETLDNDRRSREAQIANEPNPRVFERVILNPGVVVDAQPTTAGATPDGPQAIFTGEPTTLLSERSRGSLGMGLPGFESPG